MQTQLALLPPRVCVCMCVRVCMSVCKITASWNITYGGENPKLSVAKAREIYDEVFWIKAQVEEALAESLDFTKA